MIDGSMKEGEVATGDVSAFFHSKWKWEMRNGLGLG